MKYIWLLLVCVVFVGCDITPHGRVGLISKYEANTYVHARNYNTMKNLYISDIYYDEKDKTFKYLLYDFEEHTFIDELFHEEDLFPISK